MTHELKDATDHVHCGLCGREVPPLPNGGPRTKKWDEVMAIRGEHLRTFHSLAVPRKEARE